MLKRTNLTKFFLFIIATLFVFLFPNKTCAQSASQNLQNFRFTAFGRDGEPMTTLHQDDIRILVDGVPQNITHFEAQKNNPIALVIMIDNSASQEYLVPLSRQIATVLINTFAATASDRFAIVSFSGNATIEQDLTSDIAEVRAAIAKVKFIPPAGYIGAGRVMGTPPAQQATLGTTSLWDVLLNGEKMLGSVPSDMRRAIFLLTDGDDTSSQTKMKTVIERLAQLQINVYTIGIGDSVNYGEVKKLTLKKLAEQTGGRAFFPEIKSDKKNGTLNVKVEEAQRAIEQTRDSLRASYLVNFEPNGKNRDLSKSRVRIEILNPELRKQGVQLAYPQSLAMENNALAPTH